MEQSMAFPWTAFLCIPLPPTAASQRVQCLCLCMRVYLHLKVVLEFVLLSWSLQTKPAQIPSNACSDSRFDDLEVCYLLSQNVKISWGRLQSVSPVKSLRWKWNTEFSAQVWMHFTTNAWWNPAALKKEHGGWWCQQGKHLGPTEPNNGSPLLFWGPRWVL